MTTLREAALPTSENEQGLAGLATSWLSSVGARAQSTSALVIAETRLALMSVVVMTFLALLAAVSVLAAWGLLTAGLTIWAVQSGAPIWAALLGMGCLHALLGILAWRGVTHFSAYLEFSATREQFRSSNEIRHEVGNGVCPTKTKS